MVGRDRRYGRSRQLGLKAKVGIATAVLVGGGAIGVAAAASSHSPTAASNSSFSFNHHHQSWQTSQNQLLAQLLTTRNQNTVLNNLANLTSVRTFVQARVGNQVFAAQRGVVVFATNRWVIVRSANNSLHVWALSGNTRLTNATTLAQTNALLANLRAAQLAMQGNMISAVNTVSNVNTVNALVMPAANTTTTTINIQGTGVTVSVTVTRNNTATVNTFTNGRITNQANFLNLLAAVRAAQAQNKVAVGDMIVIAGVRAHGMLQARTAVFTPATNAGTALGTGTNTGINTGAGTTCTSSAPCSGTRS